MADRITASLKTDDLTNTIAVEGVKAVTNLGTHTKHLFSFGATRPAGIL